MLWSYVFPGIVPEYVKPVAAAAAAGHRPAGQRAVEVRSGHRVGVTLAHDVPWRFWVAGDPTVSAYKRSPRAVVD